MKSWLRNLMTRPQISACSACQDLVHSAFKILVLFADKGLVPSEGARDVMVGQAGLRRLGGADTPMNSKRKSKGNGQRKGSSRRE